MKLRFLINWKCEINCGRNDIGIHRKQVGLGEKDTVDCHYKACCDTQGICWMSGGLITSSKKSPALRVLELMRIKLGSRLFRVAGRISVSKLIHKYRSVAWRGVKDHVESCQNESSEISWRLLAFFASWIPHVTFCLGVSAMVKVSRKHLPSKMWTLISPIPLLSSSYFASSSRELISTS